MLSLEKAQEYIESELRNIAIPDEPVSLYAPIKYILEIGGKRIRPALLLLACDLFDSNYQKALSPALGVEVFHNFTLLHDDLMDNSPIRRGMPTVHIKWNSNIAILSGDVMSILANNLICKVDPDVSTSVFNLFSKTALEVCEGQMLDMEYSEKDNVTIPEYINMIGLKTSVLIAASLSIGALVGGAKKTDSDVLYNFGMNLGLAFQLQDDLLDTYGDQQLFGKKIGNDIITNKKTFLLIKALEKAKGHNYNDLMNYFSDKKFDGEEKINHVIKIYNDLEIKSETEKQINMYFSKSLENLSALKIPDEKKQELFNISNNLMNRKK